MIPKLYKKLESEQMTYVCDFNRCSSCVSTETLNGEKLLTLRTDTNDNAAQKVISGMIIKAKANSYQTPQMYIVKNTLKNLDGTIEINCEHIKNLAYSAIVWEYASTTAKTPQQIINIMKNNGLEFPLNMNFISTITKKGVIENIEAGTKFGEVLSGQGGFLNIFGGELEFDNRNITLKKEIGTLRDYPLRYGSNISSAQQSESIENTYSHCLPYGKVSYSKNNLGTDIVEKTITTTEEIAIPNSVCPYHRTIPICCDLVSQGYIVYQNGTGYDEAREAMKTFALGIAKSKKYYQRNVSLTIDFDSTLEDMKNFHLGDTVPIILDVFGTKAISKINKYEFDSLNEKYSKLVLGELKLTLADVLLGR